MKKVTFAALAALTITACSSGPKFQVNGIYGNFFKRLFAFRY